MQRFLFIPALFSLLVFTGCQQARDPGQVSEAFWTAVQQQRSDSVEQLIAPGSRSQAGERNAVLPIGQFTLGRIIIDGDLARVDTEVEVLADKPVTVPLVTRLIRHQDRWLVDYDATVSDIRSGGELAQLLGQLRDFGQQLGAQLDQSIDTLEQHLPELQQQLQRFEERIREAMPELQRQLRQFSRQLEESLEDFEQEQQAERQDEQGQTI